jgi:hypothetical protein
MRSLCEGLRYSPHAVWVMIVVYPMRILSEQEIWVISPYENAFTTGSDTAHMQCG